MLFVSQMLIVSDYVYVFTLKTEGGRRVWYMVYISLLYFTFLFLFFFFSLFSLTIQDDMVGMMID